MRKVLISASIGCDLDDQQRLYDLLDAGAGMVRVPFWREFEPQITMNLERIRSYNPHIPFVIDTKSEKIRFGDFFTNPFPLDPNKEYWISSGERAKDPTHLPLRHKEPCSLCEVGDEIVCGDGEAVLRVKEKNREILLVSPTSYVSLPSRKGLAIPGRNIISKNMSKIDYEIDYSIRHKVDWLAISFTESPDDIEYVRQRIMAAGKERPFIMGKIENSQGIRNLEGIVRVSDGIMIARGDLPSHEDYGKMGLYQKQILKLCNLHKKFGMVSTGTLMSSISRPRPYPSEITDITNSVLDGADAIQLCEETVYDSSDRVNAVLITKHIIDTTLDYLKHN
ncbi:MAG: pyruvate kinase [Candidatus Pacearchaeota archaeon]